MRRSRGEMYIGHDRLCVCLSVCVSLATFPHNCTDPNVTYGNGRGCPPVVHYWAHLQSVHDRFRCYDNIAPNAKCQRVLVLALCLVTIVIAVYRAAHTNCYDGRSWRNKSRKFSKLNTQHPAGGLPSRGRIPASIVNSTHITVKTLSIEHFPLNGRIEKIQYC